MSSLSPTEWSQIVNPHSQRPSRLANSCCPCVWPSLLHANGAPCYPSSIQHPSNNNCESVPASPCNDHLRLSNPGTDHSILYNVLNFIHDPITSTIMLPLTRSHPCHSRSSTLKAPTNVIARFIWSWFSKTRIPTPRGPKSQTLGTLHGTITSLYAMRECN